MVSRRLCGALMSVCIIAFLLNSFYITTLRSPVRSRHISHGNDNIKNDILSVLPTLPNKFMGLNISTMVPVMTPMITPFPDTTSTPSPSLIYPNSAYPLPTQPRTSSPPSPPPPSSSPPPLYAFTTIVSNEEYVEGAMVLGYSLRRAVETKKRANVASYYDYLVLVPSTITIDSQERLRNVGWSVFVVPRDLAPLCQGSFWAETFNKLYLFNMTQYTAVAFFDADMLILSSPEAELFSEDILQTKVPNASWIGALGNNQKKGKKPYFQSGMMLLRPDRATFNALFSRIDSKDCRDLNARDGSFLRQHFGKNYSNLDDALSLHLRPEEGLEGVIGFHFRGEWKPWMKFWEPPTPKLRVSRKKGDEVKLELGPAYDAWWEMFEKMMAELRTKEIMSTDGKDSKEKTAQAFDFLATVRKNGQSVVLRETPHDVHESYFVLNRNTASSAWAIHREDVDDDLRNLTLKNGLTLRWSNKSGESCDETCAAESLKCVSVAFAFSNFNNCDSLDLLLRVESNNTQFCSHCINFHPEAFQPSIWARRGSKSNQFRCYENRLRVMDKLPTCSATTNTTGATNGVLKRLCPCAKLGDAMDVDDANIVRYSESPFLPPSMTKMTVQNVQPTNDDGQSNGETDDPCRIILSGGGVLSSNPFEEEQKCFTSTRLQHPNSSVALQYARGVVYHRREDIENGVAFYLKFKVGSKHNFDARVFVPCASLPAISASAYLTYLLDRTLGTNMVLPMFYFNISVNQLRRIFAKIQEWPKQRADDEVFSFIHKRRYSTTTQRAGDEYVKNIVLVAQIVSQDVIAQSLREPTVQELTQFVLSPQRTFANVLDFVSGGADELPGHHRSHHHHGRRNHRGHVKRKNTKSFFAKKSASTSTSSEPPPSFVLTSFADRFLEPNKLLEGRDLHNIFKSLFSTMRSLCIFRNNISSLVPSHPLLAVDLASTSTNNIPNGLFMTTASGGDDTTTMSMAAINEFINQRWMYLTSHIRTACEGH